MYPLLHVQQPAPAPNEAIRVSVNRVNVGVIVTGADGQFVDGLKREDFRVLDNGAEQTVHDFAPVDEPAKVLVLIEAGPAVYLMQGGHLRAAYALLAGLSAGDQVAVVKYNDTASTVASFSKDKQTVGEAFQRLNFNLGFGALNLSDSIDTVLDWLGQTSGKKTIVLLSTGLDTSSPMAATALLNRLRTGDVRILAVSLAGEMRTPAPDKKRKAPSPAELFTAQQLAQADEVLRRLSAATGGRAYFPTNEKEFDAAYAEIAQIVRHEYSLGFTPQVLDGEAHVLDVKVMVDASRQSGLRVDHRQAYLARK
jgi:VWFA-related protein